DVVVRRHLVQLVSLLLKRAGAIGPIREADLRRLLERDADRYRRAETITFTQVYLDPARRGARLEADTARILAALRSGRPAEGAGDPFLLGSTFTRRSQAEIRRLVGDRVADWTAQATLGDWLGPVRSTYGVHLLRVDERIPGHLPAPSLLAVAEIGDGRLTIEWRTPIVGAPGAELRPVLPEGCFSTGEPTLERLDAASVVRWPVECAPARVVGRHFTVAGIVEN